MIWEGAPSSGVVASSFFSSTSIAVTARASSSATKAIRRWPARARTIVEPARGVPSGTTLLLASGAHVGAPPEGAAGGDDAATDGACPPAQPLAQTVQIMNAIPSLVLIGTDGQRPTEKDSAFERHVRVAASAAPVAAGIRSAHAEPLLRRGLHDVGERPPTDEIFRVEGLQRVRERVREVDTHTRGRE